MASTDNVDAVPPLEGLVQTEQIASSALITAIPRLFQLASASSASVVNVSADQRPDAFADIAKVMAVSQSGLGLFVSSSPQEARDLAVIAQAAALKSNTSFIHFYDGKEPVDFTADLDTLRSLVADEELVNYKRKADTAAPASAYLQYKQQQDQQPADVAAAIREAFAGFAAATGRKYGAFSYTGAANAEQVVVAMGSAAAVAEKNLPATGGLVTVRVYRPFAAADFFEAVPKSVKRVAVLEPQDYTATWNPVFLEIAAAYQVAQDESVDIISVQYGASVEATTVESVFENLSQADVPRRFVVGATQSNKAEKVEYQEPIETPYIKLLDQVFQDRLDIANAVNSASVWSPDAASPEKSTPEYGYGKLIHNIQERARFIDAVEKAVQDTKLTGEAHKALTQWLLLAKSTKHQPQQTDSAAEVVVQALEAEVDTLPAAKSLLAKQALLRSKSNWLIGSDSWAYDLGQSGIHHVITSGENVNLLIVDTTSYSSPVERENRKKDIGLYAMNYGNVYVASVAIFSSYTGVLHALLEADAYNGPSIVLAYLPQAEERIPLNTLKETKVCVDNGSWPLYRWNPALEAAGKECFSLDSQRIKRDLEAFLKRENHLSNLVAENPDIAKTLVSSLESVSLSIILLLLLHGGW